MTDDERERLAGMLHTLRCNGFSPLAVPVCGGATVDPALVHFQDGVVTVLVLPVYGAATVMRMEAALDQANPSWIVKSVLFQWTAPQDQAAHWLLVDHGLVPAEAEQQP
jgi:hypothetical protein